MVEVAHFVVSTMPVLAKFWPRNYRLTAAGAGEKIGLITWQM